MGATNIVLQKIDYCFHDGGDHDLDELTLHEIEQAMARGATRGGFMMLDAATGEIRRGWWYKIS
jgi:hypothetical protein